MKQTPPAPQQKTKNKKQNPNVWLKRESPPQKKVKVREIECKIAAAVQPVTSQGFVVKVTVENYKQNTGSTDFLLMSSNILRRLIERKTS